MKSINKKISAVAIAAVAALVLGACGSSGSSDNADAPAADAGNSSDAADDSAADDATDDSAADDGAADDAEPVTLNFEVGFGADSPQLAKLQELSDAYTAANPNVTVEINSVSADYESDLKVRMAANNLPDLWVTHGWSLLRYSPFLEPLSSQPWAENFNPALGPAMQSEDGEFYALPINTDISGVIYSQAALDKIGVDPADLATWDAFNAALAQLKDAGVIPVSASSKDSWLAGNVADFITTGAFDDAALQGFLDGTFDTEGYGKLMDLVAGWADAGYFNPDFASASQDDIAQNLATGDTAFVFVQNGIIANAKTFDPEAEIGFMPVPTFDGNAFLIGGEGYAIGVWKDSANKQAALDYLAYLAEPAQIEAQAGVIGSPAGLTNATVDLGDLQPSFDKFVSGNQYPLLPYFDRVYLPNGAWDAMISTISGVVTGQMTAAEATDQMKSEYESLRAQQN